MGLSEPLRDLRRIKIIENGEPLVDILAFSRDLRWAESHPVFDYVRVRWCRRIVARMLAQAQQRLPKGIHLGIVEGWRSPEIQRMMYLHTWQEIRRRHPCWSEAALRRLTNRFSAPPDDVCPPPHTTGGAVDLHLVQEDGTPLDMTSPHPEDFREAAPMFCRGLSRTAERHRTLLREVLTSVGLTNYAAEWWHWSYGDSGWAHRTGAPHAVYGQVWPPDWEI
ncbi:MAG: D-alanyl-D-alanine carboxypeptidase family protein [Armatimonadetes bacterium]|nr:D-alanyl-D-alanine carboxypeptidase family protein [Armatimonadota bacterium]